MRIQCNSCDAERVGREFPEFNLNAVRVPYKEKGKLIFFSPEYIRWRFYSSARFFPPVVGHNALRTTLVLSTKETWSQR